MRLPFELVLAKDDFTYGDTLQRAWDAGEPFINVEHDIVPWPGALEALWRCPDQPPWCGYRYPLGYSGLLEDSLGCVCIRPTRSVAWNLKGILWNQLDAAIFRAMRPNQWHEHRPPVAHLTMMKELP